MTRDEFINEMNTSLKLVRTEYGFTQEVMAKVMGISKKTLVEIEKGRSSLGWTGAVALCSIFSQSAVLAGLLGGEAGDMIQALAFADQHLTLPKTMGGRVWWRNVETYGKYRIQQNLISWHYRALNPNDERICASYKKEEIIRLLDELEG